MQSSRLFLLVAALVAATCVVDAAPTNKPGATSIETATAAKPSSAAPVTASLDDILSKPAIKKTAPASVPSPGTQARSPHVYSDEDDLSPLGQGMNSTSPVVPKSGSPFKKQESFDSGRQESVYDIDFEDDPLASKNSVDRKRHMAEHKNEDLEKEDAFWDDYFEEDDSSGDLDFGTAPYLFESTGQDEYDDSDIFQSAHETFESTGTGRSEPGGEFKPAGDHSSEFYDPFSSEVDGSDDEFHSFSESTQIPQPGSSSLSSAPVASGRGGVPRSDSLDSSNDMDSLDSSTDEEMPITPVKPGSPQPGEAGGARTKATPPKVTKDSPASVSSSRAQ